MGHSRHDAPHVPHEPARRDDGPAEQERAATPAPSVAQVLRLQQGAGNGAVARWMTSATGPMLLRGQGSSRAGEATRTLRLGDRSFRVRPVDGYFEFLDARGSYIQDNGELVHGDDGEIRVRDPLYAERLLEFFGTGLTLWRGVTRQHPLWYELDQLHILMPLGTGELPDWDTNVTTFIPFGPTRDGARAIAGGKRGMGPGDDRQMITNYPALRAQGGAMRVGGAVGVTVRAGGIGAGFYNYNEIQVRGPLTQFEYVPVTQADFEGPAAPDAAPAPADVATYQAEHGSLRHAAIEQALAAAGPQGQVRLQAARAASGVHVEALTALRDLVQEGLGEQIEELADLDPTRINRLDSSVNREAHAAYLAAVIGGSSPEQASDMGMLAAAQWLAVYGPQWRDRARAAAVAAAAPPAAPAPAPALAPVAPGDAH
jgi:hypothetical protein